MKHESFYRHPLWHSIFKKDFTFPCLMWRVPGDKEAIKETSSREATHRFRTSNHRRLCRVKNMLAKYLKYHKARLTPTTPVTSIAISSVKMSIGRKSLTNLRSEMIFLQGKPVFYIFLPSTPPYWQIIFRFCWQWTPKWQQSESRSCATYFCLSVVVF